MENRCGNVRQRPVKLFPSSPVSAIAGDGSAVGAYAEVLDSCPLFREYVGKRGRLTSWKHGSVRDCGKKRNKGRYTIEFEDGVAFTIGARHLRRASPPPGTRVGSMAIPSMRKCPYHPQPPAAATATAANLTFKEFAHNYRMKVYNSGASYVPDSRIVHEYDEYMERQNGKRKRPASEDHADPGSPSKVHNWGPGKSLKD